MQCRVKCAKCSQTKTKIKKKTNWIPGDLLMYRLECRMCCRCVMNFFFFKSDLFVPEFKIPFSFIKHPVNWPVCKFSCGHFSTVSSASWELISLSNFFFCLFCMVFFCLVFLSYSIMLGNVSYARNCILKMNWLSICPSVYMSLKIIERKCPP